MPGDPKETEGHEADGRRGRRAEEREEGKAPGVQRRRERRMALLVATAAMFLDRWTKLQRRVWFTEGTKMVREEGSFPSAQL